jgi:predicted TIM-barrel fold metal-dependent hydrolase
MDRAGVDISVLTPVATKPSQVTSINDWVAGVVDSAPRTTDGAPRLVAFGSMHPDFAEPDVELARIAALGFRGIKLHPEWQEFAPDDPRADAIYAAASNLGLAVLFHAGGDLMFDTVRGTPAAFATVLDRHPRLRAILAHLGGFRAWNEFAEALAGRELWIDTAFTLGHLPDEELVAIVRRHGADRVLFGSDGPWTDALAELTHLRRLGLTGEELTGIEGGNAARLLGLADAGR